ncbi:MAG: ribonuclease H family protein [Bacteroidales bacterium]|jgi:ribonuclease HI|nr:ribonuclease H family protein [Bacteroidales bacterium]
MTKKKYYVVWNGFQPGVFDTWEACKKQVEGFSSPKYKAFPNLEMATLAFEQGSEQHLVKRDHPIKMIMDGLYGYPVFPSIAVDGACSGKTRLAEYQGVDAETKTLLFKKGPFMDGTNNVMEFLALVHALALCKQQNITVPVYSDSVNAMKWVKAKKAGTKLEKTAHNQVLFDLIARAEKWLQTNTYTNEILKWQTQAWGEIPADFGRK